MFLFCILHRFVYYQNIKMAAKLKEVFQRFYVELVRALPINDAVFVAKLYSYQLLDHDLKSEIEALTTTIEKSQHFLDKSIYPSIDTDDHKRFDNLLIVMETSDDTSVIELAKMIRSSLRKRSMETYGRCL